MYTDHFPASPCRTRTAVRGFGSSLPLPSSVPKAAQTVQDLCPVTGLGFSNPSSKGVLNKWMSCTVNYKKKVAGSFTRCRELKGPCQGRRPFI